ncbi:cyclic nucleotide-gated ion channel 1-like [Durio zibethinus]|uniref:Cyclic nucleotide-gated ion channel 1-like n=1 Tax=Durio zibethinus TaxID=66656 RepID=A0A6P5X5S1_DURZI|nr:cyclic nucleotide-gated ion channel 1-like [Durio zibethinus]
MGRDKSERSSSGSVSRSQGHRNLEGVKSRHSPKTSLNQGKASERSKTLVSGKIQRCLKSVSDIKSIKKILNPLGPFSSWWDTLFLLSSVIAISLDPLFFYLPVVNEDKKCLFMDRKLGIAAMVLRSLLDGLYIIYVTCRVLSPCANKRGNSSRDAWAIARGYFLLRLFLIDIISVLPLPQIVVLVIIPMMRDVRFLDAMNLLTIVVFCQSIPRIFRIYQLFKRDKRTSATLAEATWAKAACNLFLYMLAGHIS